MAGEAAMSAAVAAIVGAGLALALALGIVAGLDATGVALLALMVVVGGVSISAARKARSGAVQPARCRDCGGLVSRNAPYCTHCGGSLGS